jgi:hypothetical protein
LIFERAFMKSAKFLTARQRFGQQRIEACALFAAVGGVGHRVLLIDPVVRPAASRNVVTPLLSVRAVPVTRPARS